MGININDPVDKGELDKIYKAFKSVTEDFQCEQFGDAIQYSTDYYFQFRKNGDYGLYKDVLELLETKFTETIYAIKLPKFNNRQFVSKVFNQFYRKAGIR